MVKTRKQLVLKSVQSEFIDHNRRDAGSHPFSHNWKLNKAYFAFCTGSSNIAGVHLPSRLLNKNEIAFLIPKSHATRFMFAVSIRTKRFSNYTRKFHNLEQSCGLSPRALLIGYITQNRTNGHHYFELRRLIIYCEILVLTIYVILPFPKFLL